MIRRHFFTVLLLVSGLSPAAVTAESIELPEIGMSADSVISPEKEREIGREMMRRLRHSGKVLDAPELEAYIKDLGYQLLAARGEPGNEQFTFFLIDDPVINAFAMPGGYIGMHSGLVLATRNENELAAVLAHEISHVTQRHLARGFEKASEMNLPTTAAVIAAILLGAYDARLGEAALAASIAGTTQMQLDFSRANESEADRVGIQLLAHAGFDPHGMPGFFERLQKETRYYGGAPEFLSTHPVTLTRIADSRNRAAQYPSTRSRSETLNYELVKAELRVVTSSDKASLLKQLKAELAEGRNRNSLATTYAYVLALKESGELEEAKKQMGLLLKKQPERIAFLRTQASIEIAMGREKEAFDLYRRALKLYPGNPSLTLDYSRALIAGGHPDEASLLLRELTRIHTTFQGAFELLARAEEKLGNKSAASLALAEHYYLRGEIMQAIDQLQMAQRYPETDFYHASRIEARLQQLIKENESAAFPAK